MHARAWFDGLVWESAAIVALSLADAGTTLWAVRDGATELNVVARALLQAGPAAFLAAKVLFAGWVVIGLAWVHREWSARQAVVGARTAVLLLMAIVTWNATMLVAVGS